MVNTTGEPVFVLRRPIESVVSRLAQLIARLACAALEYSLYVERRK